MQNHPVVKRLYQFRQLLLQLDPIFENVLKPQLNSAEMESIEIVATLPNIEEKSKKPKLKKVKTVQFNGNVTEVEPVSALLETEEKYADIEKRPITYKMAKNKGLTPHRKKEQRNPRVKHRNKFRRAKIRRKGAVLLFVLMSYGLYMYFYFRYENHERNLQVIEVKFQELTFQLLRV